MNSSVSQQNLRNHLRWWMETRLPGSEDCPESKLIQAVIVESLVDLHFENGAKQEADVMAAREYLFGGTCDLHCQWIGLETELVYRLAKELDCKVVM